MNYDTEAIHVLNDAGAGMNIYCDDPKVVLEQYDSITLIRHSGFDQWYVISHYDSQ